MSDTDALVYAYMLDGRGGGSVLDWDGIKAWEPEKGVLWIHLASKHPDTRDWLDRHSGFSSLVCESLLEQETRPRNLMTGEGLLLILRGVNFNPGEDLEDMVAIRMFISEKRIVTMRYRPIKAVTDIREALEKNNGPGSAGEFLVMVAGRIADRMADVVAELDDNVDALEDSVLSAESQELRAQLARLRRTTISLRRYIAPQRDVLARLLRDRIAWLDDSDRAYLRETAERTARFVEDLDSARERATITQEELNHRISEQMNKAMYTMSIVAAIFLPLSLLTGLLGINVGGIPGTDNKWAFAVVTAGLSVVAAGLVIWFKKIKWL